MLRHISALGSSNLGPVVASERIHACKKRRFFFHIFRIFFSLKSSLSVARGTLHTCLRKLPPGCLTESHRVFAQDACPIPTFCNEQACAVLSLGAIADHPSIQEIWPKFGTSFACLFLVSGSFELHASKGAPTHYRL